MNNEEEMPAVVVELSQEGYDVEQASDENLVWSSRWGSVKLAREFIFDIANRQVAQNYDHNWGESTAFFVYEVGASASAARVYNQLYITDNQLKWIPAGGEPATALKLKCYITDTKLKQNYLAPIFNTGGESGAINRNQVVALSKEGKDVFSDELRDFVFHSFCRSPMLHQVANGTAAAISAPGPNGFDAVHGLPYTPLNFVYKNTINGWQQLVGIGGTEGVVILSDRVRYISTVAGAEVSIIIWKDPYNLGSTTAIVK